MTLSDPSKIYIPIFQVKTFENKDKQRRNTRGLQAGHGDMLDGHHDAIILRLNI